MSLTEAFVTFSHDCTYEALPETTRQAAARCLLDHLGCVAGGMKTELARHVSELVLMGGGQPHATVVAAGGRRVPAWSAALANGTAANALDYDDTFHGHPGATVIAAAIAAAELAGASGADLLRAIVVGYEVCGRLLLYWQPEGGRYTRVWDTATLQTFGAVCAVALLLELTPSQTVEALGIALVTTPTARARPVLTDEKNLRPLLKSAWGWGAEAAVRAVLLARSGLTGQPFALDNLTLVWSPRWHPVAGLTGPTDALGERFLIEQVEFKPYPACRFLHSTLDAARELLATAKFAPEEIAAVQIHGFALLGDRFHNMPAPNSRSEAQFSTPFCVAALLTHGRLTPDAFDEKALHNPDVLRLARRIQIDTDPDSERRFPDRHQTRVRVSTVDGREWACERDEPEGTPTRALSTAVLRNKFVQLVEPLVGQEKAQHLAGRILEVADAPAVKELMEELGRARYPLPEEIGHMD